MAVGKIRVLKKAGTLTYEEVSVPGGQWYFVARGRPLVGMKLEMRLPGTNLADGNDSHFANVTRVTQSNAGNDLEASANVRVAMWAPLAEGRYRAREVLTTNATAANRMAAEAWLISV